MNEALRLRPDLPEAHLALATHLYYCYRDFERASVQIEIAAQTLSNNSALLQLTALIDRVRGRWEKAVAGLERATTLDPQNRELVGILVETYRCLRRYQDAERIENRLFAVEPDRPAHRTSKAFWSFAETADVR